MAAIDRPVAKPRPVYLNLFAIRMPLPAVVSILHRASGALLFAIGIPLALCAVQNALVSQEAWAQMRVNLDALFPSSSSSSSPGRSSTTCWPESVTC
jgi:hypothetical protein